MVNPYGLTSGIALQVKSLQQLHGFCRKQATGAAITATEASITAASAKSPVSI